MGVANRADFINRSDRLPAFAVDKHVWIKKGADSKFVDTIFLPDYIKIGWVKGKVFSEEHRFNLSKAMKGIVRSKEHRANISKSKKGNTNCLGRKYSSETIKKMSLAKKGKESKLKGRPFSDEHRANLSKAMKGHKRCVGRKLSEETKLKISLSKRKKLT